jgi:hypothetical protein
MNLRKIKLALTVDLINQQQHVSPIGVQQFMSGIKEAGAFLGQVLVNNESISSHVTRESYALHFENCTLDVNFFKNPSTNTHTVQGFNVY